MVTADEAGLQEALNAAGPELVRMRLLALEGQDTIVFGGKIVPRPYVERWLADRLEEANRERDAREERIILAVRSAARASWAAAIAALAVALATVFHAYVIWKALEMQEPEETPTAALAAIRSLIVRSPSLDALAAVPVARRASQGKDRTRRNASQRPS
jgi:hypothetical protein